MAAADRTRAAGARMPASLALRLQPAIELTREQFFRFCQLNRDVRIERDAEGGIAVTSPTGGETGARCGRLLAAVLLWADDDGSGVAFDSSTGFELPDGAVRSPDTAWVRRVRLARIAPEDRRGFLPLCPDFVVELLSPSDSRPRRRTEDGRIPGERRAAGMAARSGRSAPPPVSYRRVTSASMISTRSTGVSPSVGAASIRATTSNPATTTPNTV